MEITPDRQGLKVDVSITRKKIHGENILVANPRTLEKKKNISSNLPVLYLELRTNLQNSVLQYSISERGEEGRMKQYKQKI